MVKLFSASERGYAHRANGKPCQDFSSSYQDSLRQIITCCDGHGGEVYIRSQIGSKLAGEALLSVFSKIPQSLLRYGQEEEVLRQIKLKILCEYNLLVEKELAAHPIRKKELSHISPAAADCLCANKAKAYGTTLSGALLMGNYLLVACIGDTEALGVKDGRIIKIFNTDDDPAGNVTYSMCQEDAFDYLRVRVLDFRKLDAMVLATDGFTGPYQSYDNLLSSALKPLIRRAGFHRDAEFAEELVRGLAAELGTGDDVSLAYLIRDKVKRKYYL